MPVDVGAEYRMLVCKFPPRLDQSPGFAVQLLAASEGVKFEIGSGSVVATLPSPG